MANQMTVKRRIRHYISKAVAEEIDDEDDIFALGVINSLFAMQLVQFLENEFSITAEREDLNINNFCSIAAMTNFVLKKLGTPGDRELADGHPTD
jgi:acyl carrier protein